MTDQLLDIVPMPALVAVLHAKEREKGEPLTEAEVLHIRDTAPCIALPRDMHLQMIEKRGYIDIDPENVWLAWQEARGELRDLD
ncbi:hypothetical protein NAP1_14318 [Erythrobacter sp. NAP1]|nr:hypothetical protein NAP1_14318 [Erythrobacter sp. NAP1]